MKPQNAFLMFYLKRGKLVNCVVYIAFTFPPKHTYVSLLNLIKSGFNIAHNVY